MKIESPTFTIDDLKGFLDAYVDRERHLLADRLKQASDRLAALGPRVQPERSEKEEWTAHELLAHIAVLSKFYGVLVHRISGGQMAEVDLIGNVNLRDVAGAQMAAMSADELLQAIRADHARTAKLLRTIEPSALRRSATLETGESITAEFIARYPLVNHLEQHVEQLEQQLS